MSLFNNYIEVYSTFDKEEFLKARNTITESNIPFKNTTKSSQLRGGLSHNQQGNMFATDGTPNVVYSLSVKKGYEEIAKKILNSL